jgi:hypothetical protein
MFATRRTFVAKLAAVSAFLPAMPRVFSSGNMRSVCDDQGLPIVPDGLISEDFWRDLRSEFLIPRDEAFFNTGTLGSSPKAVRDAVIAHMNHVDRDIAHWDYKAEHEQYFTGYANESGCARNSAN